MARCLCFTSSPKPAGHRSVGRRGRGSRMEPYARHAHQAQAEAAFKKHRKEIEILARRKYLYGDREPEDSVLLRTLDIV
jgi:Protein of unknown function (DUF1488)